MTDRLMPARVGAVGEFSVEVSPTDGATVRIEFRLEGGGGEVMATTGPLELFLTVPPG
jgi:hypothetical protein